MDEQKCQDPSTSNHQQINNLDLINCFNKNTSEEQQNNENNKELFENLEFCLCSSCGLPIQDRFIYKVLDSQFYHEKCLNCSVCRQPFPSGTCFSRNSLLFCREHFLNTFGPKCSRCAAPIDERSIVRRANQHIYHLQCFQCVVCKREMDTGDQFYLIPMDGRLVCRQDFETAQKESAEMDLGNKRPRTTISAKSLEMLKHAYQCSNKPARHIREQLASQTGLDMRVVQVWFQNRRAKEKRLKKDTHRRYLSNNQSDQHSPDCFSIDMRSNGRGCGSGPSSVPSSIGLQNLFGRNGTIDSDSGASNNDAESPIYSIYTNPSEIDVDGSGEFCPDQQTTLDGGEQQRQQQHYHNQQLNVDSFPTGIVVSEQSKTPQPPQQQLFSFEQQLNISTTNQQQQHSQPSTPQQLNNPNQSINNNLIFSPPISSINCSQPSQAALLAEQQYLLAAAFGAPTQPIQLNQPFLMVGGIHQQQQQQNQQQFPPTSTPEFYQQNFNGINLPSTTQNMAIQFSPLQMHPSHYNPITQ